MEAHSQLIVQVSMQGLARTLEITVSRNTAISSVPQQFLTPLREQKHHAFTPASRQVDIDV